MNVRPLFAAHNVARAARAKLQRALALHGDQNVADLDPGFICRASRRHALDAQPAVVLTFQDGHADADIGVVHHFFVVGVFFRAEIIAPAVAGRLNHCLRGCVGKLLLVVIINKIAFEIGADLRSFERSRGTGGHLQPVKGASLAIGDKEGRADGEEKQ